MVDVAKAIDALAEMMKSGAYPAVVRAGAAEGLGFAGGADARKALLEVAKSGAYPADVRAAAAKVLGRATTQA
jgi:HEAT repeat protein